MISVFDANPSPNPAVSRAEARDSDIAMINQPHTLHTLVNHLFPFAT